jgi:hypothetical protein
MTLRGSASGTKDRTVSGALEERLSQYPHLRDRFEAILGIVENQEGTCQTADEAERRAIAEVRQLGQEVLEDWAQNQSQAKAREYAQKEGLIRDGKKNGIGIAPLERLK